VKGSSEERVPNRRQHGGRRRFVSSPSKGRDVALALRVHLAVRGSAIAQAPTARLARSDGRSVAYDFADNMARGHVKPRGKACGCGTDHVASQGPGCPIRQRFSAMLADCRFETCGTEIIGNAERAAASFGALTGMLYRADVEKHSRYCSR